MSIQFPDLLFIPLFRLYLAAPGLPKDAENILPSIPHTLERSIDTPTTKLSRKDGCRPTGPQALADIPRSWLLPRQRKLSIGDPLFAGAWLNPVKILSPSQPIRACSAIPVVPSPIPEVIHLQP